MSDEKGSATRKKIVTAAVAVGALLGAAGIAGAAVNAQQTDATTTTGDSTITSDSAATNDSTTDDSATDNASDANGQHDGKGGSDETPLTGQTATDVTNAALAAVPGGTVDDVEGEVHGDAIYEAHVTDADGNNVRVTLDAGFAVVEIMPGR